MRKSSPQPSASEISRRSARIRACARHVAQQIRVSDDRKLEFSSIPVYNHGLGASAICAIVGNARADELALLAQDIVERHESVPTPTLRRMVFSAIARAEIHYCEEAWAKEDAKPAVVAPGAALLECYTRELELPIQIPTSGADQAEIALGGGADCSSPIPDFMRFRMVV